MRLVLLHAGIATRSCGDCQRYLYYDRGSDDFGSRVERGGLPVLRPKNVKTPCQWCPKIPPGESPKPENAIELSEKNIAAVVHYRECKAVGEFPDDAIVRRNAALIRGAEEVAERVHQMRSGQAALAAMRMAGRS